ncbi:hypothetical protein SAMN05920897_12021 [Alkalispirochaeta americana]|uniref:HEAT repeat-containing protein n=1 Tax=Alkalispirochaeta americana TaxID=159291 RepID=A0A1N6X459_9SPIO|nr:hypothetical protein [Alkalispirochaeta americana]SIQ97138.1 hypothetical protein SAMN05920897_12021 [Alkalispirochaeta americana]
MARFSSSPGERYLLLTGIIAVCSLGVSAVPILSAGEVAGEIGGEIAGENENLHSSREADRPHWIPVGRVSRELEQQALQQRVFLEHHSQSIQRQGLAMIRSSLDLFDRADLRLSAVPLVVDMLDREYRILRVPARYQVDSPTRTEALHLLADLGGETAREQLRRSLEADSDGTVRATAALLLARSPQTSPDQDLASIAASLRQATRRGGPEEEIHRLLQAARNMIPQAWEPEIPDLVYALGEIVQGPYSSGLRRSSLSMLEELIRR